MTTPPARLPDGRFAPSGEPAYHTSQMKLSPDDLATLDAFRSAHGLRSRTAAVRWLLDLVRRQGWDHEYY